MWVFSPELRIPIILIIQPLLEYLPNTEMRRLFKKSSSNYSSFCRSQPAARAHSTFILLLVFFVFEAGPPKACSLLLHKIWSSPSEPSLHSAEFLQEGEGQAQNLICTLPSLKFYMNPPMPQKNTEEFPPRQAAVNGKCLGGNFF